MEFPEFLSRFTDCKFVLNEKLSLYGGYKTGGRAKFFITPKSVKSLADTVLFCAENGIKYFILGNGTNVLFSDKGFDGAIIRTGDLKGIKRGENGVTVNCGENLSAICKFARDGSLTGVEELSGIPGSVGGAAVMNAGAFGKSFSAVAEEITALKDGKIVKYSAPDCGFSYRNSRFKDGKEIVLSAKIKLFSGDKGDIIKRTEEFAVLRKTAQPTGRTCGSVFKNPDGYHAAELIEKAGLKGLKKGGAEISLLHANFIIAKNGATSADVYSLIKTVGQKISEEYGIKLKEEIIYVGEFT